MSRLACVRTWCIPPYALYDSKGLDIPGRRRWFRFVRSTPERVRWRWVLRPTTEWWR